MAISNLVKRTIDIDAGIMHEDLRRLFAVADAQAHTFKIAVTSKGVPQDLSGHTVVGYFMTNYRGTVVITGSVSGSTATLVLPATCYAYNTGFQLIIRLVSGSTKTAIYWGSGYVTRSATSPEIDPGGVVPDLDDLLAKLDEMEAAKTAANTAAANANEAASKSVRYDTVQSLENEKKAQARTNIDASIDLGEVFTNLYDSSTTLDDKTIFKSDGAVHNSTGSCASDFIDISGLASITAVNTVVIVFYDSSKAMISAPTDGNTVLERKKYTVPEGAVYVRVGANLRLKESIQISSGSFELPDLKLSQSQVPWLNNYVSYTVDQEKAETNKYIARNNIDAIYKSDIIIERENLLDTSTIVENKIIFTSDGNLHDRDGYFSSDYIDITGSDEVIVFTSSNPPVACYDANKTFISGATRTFYINTIRYVFSVPNGTRYIRISALLSAVSTTEVTTKYITISNLRQSGQEGTAFYVTPEMFGAVGDGITDDSNAFELAIADRRDIRLGRKTYKANLFINRDNVTIYGSGADSVIVPADTTKPIIKINTDTAESVSDIIRQTRLRDFKLYGNMSDVVGISIRCAQYFFFDRLVIERCHTEGIRIRGVFDSRITNCAIHICGNRGFLGDDDGLGNYAITIDATTGMNTNAIAFLGMRIEHTPRFIKFQNTQQLMFTDCKFETHAAGYPNDPTLAPIKGIGTAKGIIFTNCIIAYSGSLADSETVLLANGNPLVYTHLNDITANGDESYVLFSACQFRTQKTCRYFFGDYIHFVGCTFNRCSGATEGNILKKHSSLIDCNMAFTNGVRALKIEGEQVLVDNTRINVTEDDPATSVIDIDSTATLGKVEVIYNGSDRNNLATGVFNIEVDFLGLRKYGHV